MPACAKLAIEDEMPGKMFSLLEELILALSLYSEDL